MAVGTLLVGGALVGLIAAVAPNRDDPKARHERGVSMYKLGRHAEALTEFNRAIELDSQNAEIYSNKGYALRALKRHDEALGAFKKAVEITPYSVIAHSDYGRLLYVLGKYVDALEEFRRITKLQPENAIAHSNAGYALYAMERYNEALAEFNKAIELRPDDASAHGCVGSILYSRAKVRVTFHDLPVQVCVDVQVEPLGPEVLADRDPQLVQGSWLPRDPDVPLEYAPRPLDGA